MDFEQLLTPLLAQDATRRGLLPTRGSAMLDFVVLAMIAVIPVMAVSIYRYCAGITQIPSAS